MKIMVILCMRVQEKYLSAMNRCGKVKRIETIQE